MSQNEPVLIAGGGIGGLAMALTLHQIGVPCQVFEAVSELKALGVGINLQPNAVRELYELGLNEKHLDQIGVQAREWALVGLNGKDVYSEPRGLEAGYRWPQYSVHRGKLQMLLLDAVTQRLGKDVIHLGSKVRSYRQSSSGTGVTACVQSMSGHEFEVEGSVLIGADGLHSSIRAQMHPNQPDIQWGGQILWRGITQAKPIRTGASFVGLGTHTHRLVFYPITPPDEQTGLAAINWIAEITVDAENGWQHSDWNRQVLASDFIHHFEDWNYDWLNVPDLLNGAPTVFEYPMIDRDPIPTWVDGNVALLGDAAHVMYPVGSNGASQAIVDARVLGAAIHKHGANNNALIDYDNQLCKDISEVVLRNRGHGPFGILNVLDERCGGVFEDIEAVLPKQEIDEYMLGYKRAAGFAIDSLNQAESIVAL